MIVPHDAYELTGKQMERWRETTHAPGLQFATVATPSRAYAGYVQPIGDPLERLVASGYVIGWLASHGWLSKRRELVANVVIRVGEFRG